jgi:hypothetical protein
VKGLRWLAAAIGLGAFSSPTGAASSPQPTPDHAVIVRFSYGSTDLSRLFELESKLETAIADAKVGEYDGNEIAVDGSDGILYMYGPDADRLFQVVEPVLKATPFMNGAKVTVRYGPPADGVREKEITIAP